MFVLLSFKRVSTYASEVLLELLLDPSLHVYILLKRLNAHDFCPHAVNGPHGIVISDRQLTYIFVKAL